MAARRKRRCARRIRPPRRASSSGWGASPAARRNDGPARGPRRRGWQTERPAAAGRETIPGQARMRAPCLLFPPACYAGHPMSTRDTDRFETKAIHAGQQPDPTTGAVMTPVYLTSTYAQSGPGEHKGFEYSRTRNPTRDALQGCLAALESGKHGLAFASGLAATDAVLHLLSSGDHVVLSDDLYGVTFRLADKVFRQLGTEQTSVGAVPGPLGAFLVLRGLKTLHVRMERHDQNGRLVAEALKRHPKGDRVTWPGLAEHPQHAVARKQMTGFGGMLTCVIKGGLPAARTFLKALRLFTVAESLGGVESLIEHPAIMTHASVPPETRRKLGIEDG